MITLPSVNDEFLTLEALEEATQAAAKAQGFAFSRRTSNLEGHDSKSPFIVLQYTKGEKWPTATKKQLSIVWIITKVEYTHNHLLLSSNELLHELNIVGTLTRIITSAINQFSNSGIVVPKDI
ncbi:2118_t:CDS:2, partial [Scutellospora calospora]